jgi:hypothetical protein
MSFLVSFQFRERLPQSAALELVSRIHREAGVSLSANVSWLRRSADFFWMTDSGDIFGDDPVRLVPQRGCGDVMRAVVDVLLRVSSPVLFHAGWGRPSRQSSGADCVMANLSRRSSTAFD